MDFQGPQEYQIPGEGWICYIKQTRITKHLQQKIQYHVNSIAIQEHWEQKGRFGRGHTHMVAWDMVEIAIQNLPTMNRKWVSKAAAKFLPYGKNMKWWKLRTEDQCPWCHQPEENKEHIIQCKDPTVTSNGESALEKLDDWLQATNTAPDLRYNIIQGLRQWQMGSLHEAGDNWWKSGTAVEQALLGWNNMLEGVISQKWQEEQMCYWKTHKSWKLSKQWMTELLKRLIMTVWDMWQHCNKALHKDTNNQQGILEA